MKTSDFQAAEELVGFVEKLLLERDLTGAQDAVAGVDAIFPDSAIAQHLAGLVWERTYIELNAEGKAPTLELYERAEHHYRRALELDPERLEIHGPRLYTCLFILGSQAKNEARLREALLLAEQLEHVSDPATRAQYGREQATAATAIAQLTGSEQDYSRAEDLFGRADEPPDDRELYFFHYYRGMLKRRFGHQEDDTNQLRQAASSFRKAIAINPRRALEYLLADCLVQLHNPREDELREMNELVPRLHQANPQDPLIRTLHQRWELRHRLMKE